MRVLLDNNIHHRFGQLISGHDVVHARSLGWAELGNGALIAAAERYGFEVMVTGDKQLRHQQNLKDRKLSIIVLGSLFIRWEFIAPLIHQVQERLDAGFETGSIVVIGP
jgi:predicted nuclease of predicted toxin-antitoxin system